jgi:Family of unknown function (DUF6785)/Domain of unknown function (DUF6784)
MENQMQPTTPSRLRPRAVFIGLLLAVGICVLTPFNNAFRQATPLGGGHFPLAPFFIFFWLSLIMAGSGRLFKRPPWLNGKELLLIWILMVLVSGIAYTGLVRTFFINLTAPFHFATPENQWTEILTPLLPANWFPRSQEAVTALYEGLPGGRRLGWGAVLQAIPWAVWVPSLLSWGLFVALCYFVMICLVNLLSQQWLRNERMNFPLLRVPLLMEEAYSQGTFGQFLLNRFMLVGLLIPVTLHLLNGLNFYFPGVPQIPTLFLTGTYFPKYGLFSGFYKIKVYIFPAFIGLAFLTTRQISFSFWIFFLLGGLLFGFLAVMGYNIPAAALGITFGPTLSRPEEMQMIGAYGVFFIFLIWLARYHLMDVSRQALGLAPAPTSSSAWFSTRLAAWGFLGGSVMLVVWLHLLGAGWWVAGLVVGAFLMIMLVSSRIITQGGLAYFTLTAAPLDGVIALFGPGIFSAGGIFIAGIIQKALFLDLRESLMPSLVHASRITEKIKQRRLMITAISIALLLGVVVSFTAMLALCYKYGIRELGLDWASSTTVHTYENVVALIETPPETSQWVRNFALMGSIVMLLLVIGYHRFFWWPLHPIGYLTCYSSAMRILWFSFFIGWLCNALCMRYGGVVLFKKVRYLFIGLIIGDFLMGGVWALVGLFSDASYQVLPS